MEKALPILFEGWIIKRATDGSSNWRERYAKLVGEIDVGFMVICTDGMMTLTNMCAHQR